MMWNLYFSVTFNSYFGLDVNLHQGVPSHPPSGMSAWLDWHAVGIWWDIVVFAVAGNVKLKNKLIQL